MWHIIPNSIKELHELFKQHQKELYLVGGSVRDFIMDEKAKDFDLATNASPDDVLKILKNFKTKRQGEAFNVVVVFTDDAPKGMEIATFREDRYETEDSFLEFLKKNDKEKYYNFIEKMK